MRKDIYEDAKRNYNFNDQKSLIWNIRDRENWPSYVSNSQKKRLTFKSIKKQVDHLAYDASNGNWVEIFDSNNTPTNCRLPINIANRKDKGCWHHECHAIITTPNNQVLIQKRSNKMIFSPNMLDISMGGIVDAGESPEDAMVREIREEIGIAIPKEKLIFIELYKHANYHPKYNKLSRAFKYAYHVKLDSNSPQLIKQNSEVSQLKFLPVKKAALLAKRHRLTHVGKLNYTYRFYQELILAISKKCDY